MVVPEHDCIYGSWSSPKINNIFIKQYVYILGYSLETQAFIVSILLYCVYVLSQFGLTQRFVSRKEWFV